MRQRLGQFGSPGVACWALLAAVWLAAGTGAQETPVGESVKPRPASKPAEVKTLPGEDQPSIYYLPDKNGELQAVPGWTLEQFTELFKLKNQLDEQSKQPPFAIESVAIDGTIDRGRAELTASCKLTVQQAGWVGVPLRFNGAVLLELAEFSGGGQHFLHFEPERHGYVMWIRGEVGKTHDVKLKLLAPVNQLGPESHLKLSLPRAAVGRLSLEIPLERAVVTVAEGGTLESTRAVGDGATAATIVGLGGELDVAWHAANAHVANLPAVLEVAGAVQIRVSGRTITSDARLTARSLGGEFDHFQVRLPRDSQYVGTPQSGISLVPAEGPAAAGKLYDVKLEKKTTGPLEVRVVTERTHNPQGEQPLELAGFEVPGAVRQWGTVSVQVEGNWQLRFGELNHAQIDELAGQVRRDSRASAFEYFVQPYALPARLVPQTTRIRVEPEYVLLVGSEEAQLRAKLKYTIRGAKVRALELDLSGWEVDTVGPETIVDVDAAATSQTHPFVIPLLQSTSGEVELTIEARQKIAHDAASMSLELPLPRGEVVAPANVAVVPADNVELVVQSDKMTGLAPQTAQQQMKLPARQQDPLFFRTDSPTPKFVAAVKVYEQSISASSIAELVVGETETRVAGRLLYQIAYQPTDHLTLAVPPGVRPERLSIMLDGQRLTPVAPRERPAAESEVALVRVPLGSPRIGRCELEVAYTVRHEKPPGAAGTLVSVPLVMPGNGQLTANELTVVPKSGVSVRYPPGEWTDETRERAAGRPAELALSARRTLARVVLALSSTEQVAAGATTIERALIETRLTAGGRQDRALYAVSTSDSRLQITLPLGVDASSLVLDVDGRRVAPESIRQRDVTVALGEASRNEHVLSMRYHLAGRAPPGGQQLNCPQLKSARWARQVYWQLDLPAAEHVLFSPEGFTHEYGWQWSGFGWRRQSALDGRDLERWVAGREQDELAQADAPPAAPGAAPAPTNRYLFSTLGEVESMDLYTISRSRLVLAASLPVLALGLLLIYFPVLRHPAVFIVAGVVVAAGTLIDPDLALLAAQAATLGLILAILAALMARGALNRPTPSTVAVRGSSQALGERGVTEMYQRPPAAALQPSTATNPLVPSSLPEAES